MVVFFLYMWLIVKYLVILLHDLWNCQSIQEAAISSSKHIIPSINLRTWVLCRGTWVLINLPVASKKFKFVVKFNKNSSKLAFDFLEIVIAEFQFILTRNLKNNFDSWKRSINRTIDFDTVQYLQRCWSIIASSVWSVLVYNFHVITWPFCTFSKYQKHATSMPFNFRCFKLFSEQKNK